MGKKYKVIYADPPWQYKVYSKKGEGRSAENHYHTMNIEDIRSLPVGEIADDDCILFLWVTFPCLLEGISVMESWGFTYKTCGFNWVKRNKKSDSFFMVIQLFYSPRRDSVSFSIILLSGFSLDLTVDAQLVFWLTIAVRKRE